MSVVVAHRRVPPSDGHANNHGRVVNGAALKPLPIGGENSCCRHRCAASGRRAAEVEGEEIAEGGFTLIELMVVLLIIAILLAIAIPTFLGVTNTAGDRAAQSNLTNALTEAKALYQVNQAYSGTTLRTRIPRSSPRLQNSNGRQGTAPPAQLATASALP